MDKVSTPTLALSKLLSSLAIWTRFGVPVGVGRDGLGREVAFGIGRLVVVAGLRTGAEVKEGLVVGLFNLFSTRQMNRFAFSG